MNSLNVTFGQTLHNLQFPRVLYYHHFYSNDWYLDSGRTDHMIFQVDSFTMIYHSFDTDVGGFSGALSIQSKGNTNMYGHTMTNAYHAPEIPCNLLYVG